MKEVTTNWKGEGTKDSPYRPDLPEGVSFTIIGRDADEVTVLVSSDYGVDEEVRAVKQSVGLGVSEWVQPTGAHDAYEEGARVTHKGKEWESTTSDNVWEPGESGWRKIGPAMPDLRARVAALEDIRDDVGEDAQAIIDVLLGEG